MWPRPQHSRPGRSYPTGRGRHLRENQDRRPRFSGTTLPVEPCAAAAPYAQGAARRRALPLVGFEKKPRPERSVSPAAAGAGRVSGAGTIAGRGVAVLVIRGSWGHEAAWVVSVAGAVPPARPAAIPVTREGLWRVSSFRWGLGNSRCAAARAALVLVRTGK